jgi:ABC-type Fe3+/spermidine/putrescine transport system ATPase subunit
MSMIDQVGWALQAEAVTHRYDGALVLDDVSLSVRTGEFLTILGPSGSGKTTLLRLIGGFEEASAAKMLRIGGMNVRGLPANHRPVATVFQHYALFPHMSVGTNIEYGLKLRGLAPADRRAEALAALALVQLPDKYDRAIRQLSGGERQRVALARALVTKPQILLLDEPMGALDEKLRRDMQAELKALQRTLGTTFIQVTHSQEEALTMSDRIVVMNRGRIEQIGAPPDIFERPATRFVADFMGFRNILTGTVATVDGDAVTIDHGAGRLSGRWTGAAPARTGQPAFFAVHPYNLVLGRGTDETPTTFRASIAAVQYQGPFVEQVVETALGRLVAISPAHEAHPGQTGPLTVAWRPAAAVVGPVSADIGS